MNPILATEGCDNIQVLLGEEEGGDLKNRAKKLLAESILKIADKLLTDKSSSGNGDDNEPMVCCIRLMYVLIYISVTAILIFTTLYTHLLDEDGNDAASDANMSRRELLKARKSKSKQRSVSLSSPIELATQAAKSKHFLV